MAKASVSPKDAKDVFYPGLFQPSEQEVSDGHTLRVVGHGSLSFLSSRENEVGRGSALDALEPR
jgi:hypothetical protein